MIEQWNEDRTGWALFSDDMTRRYRLARSLLPESLDRSQALSATDGTVGIYGWYGPAKRCTFVLLNPSTADAFEPDPTVTECCKRARALGADVLEVVNLFAFRSPYPADVKKRAMELRSDEIANNAEILAACRGAHWVIAGWGNDGAIDGRDWRARQFLAYESIELHHLGTTRSGKPKHPLARGQHRIPANQPLIPWLTQCT